MPLRVVAQVVVVVVLFVAASAALGALFWPLAVLPGVVGLAVLWAYVPQAFPFGSFVRGRTTSGAIALTFDDGPNGAHTRAVLEALDREGVRATFFVLGSAATQEPDLVRDIVARGHVVGSHGMTHRKLTWLGPAAVRAEVTEAQEAIVQAGAPRPTLFRAPHGFRSPFLGRVLREQGLRLCAWTHGVWDSDAPGTEVIVDRAVRALRPGTVLLLHDGPPGAHRLQTAEAIPAIVAAARAKGLRCVTLPELMECAGVAGSGNS